jgi:hypothetical protein
MEEEGETQHRHQKPFVASGFRRGFTALGKTVRVESGAAVCRIVVHATIVLKSGFPMIYLQRNFSSSAVGLLPYSLIS